MIQFDIPGPPRTLLRARHTRNGHTYDPAQNRDNKREIAAVAALAMRGKRKVDGPVAVSIVVYKRTEKKQIGPLMAKPDVDNIGKLYLDAMNGVVYADDCQVVNLHVEKWYDARSLTRVVVTEL